MIDQQQIYAKGKNAISDFCIAAEFRIALLI
jgi:hypothetical protein